MLLSDLIPKGSDGERGALAGYSKQLGVPYTTLQGWRDGGANVLMKGKKIIKIEKAKTLWESDEYKAKP